MATISFFSEETSFQLKNKRRVRKWVDEVIDQEGFTIKHINFIFCSDEYLLQINKQYLNHDYYTDIITFDQSEREGEISSDIFISIERVHENAQEMDLNPRDELHRVMIHGVLHLVGYGDKTNRDKTIMRQKEDACLSLLA